MSFPFSTCTLGKERTDDAGNQKINNRKVYIFSTAAAAAESLQSCPTLCDPVDGSPPGSSVPGILQAKNTGVGCHFLLQCMKVKSESEVAQPCPTPSDPMDCSPQGSSIHGISQARVLEWGAIASSVSNANTENMPLKMRLFEYCAGCLLDMVIIKLVSFLTPECCSLPFLVHYHFGLTPLPFSVWKQH